MLEQVNDTNEQFLEIQYLNMARDTELWDAPFDDFLSQVCKSISLTIDVARVSLWKLNFNQDALQQIGLYQISPSEFPTNITVNKAGYPIYFAAITQNNVIAACDAVHDSRTTELLDTYLTPLGIGAMLDAGLHKAGRLNGVICAEFIGGERNWTEPEKRYLISMADFISQRMLYEELIEQNMHIKEMNVFHQVMINNSNYCILTIDHMGRIKTLNNAVIELLGYEESELINEDLCGKIIPLSSMTEIANQMSEELEFNVSPGFEVLFTQLGMGKATDLECCFRKKDGSEIPVSLNTSILRNAAGNLKGYLCTASDISQIVNARNALQKEEQRYRFIFESANEGMFLLKSGRIVDCNYACLELYQCSKDQFLGPSVKGSKQSSSPREIHQLRFSPEYQPDGSSSYEIMMEKYQSLKQDESFYFDWLAKRFDGSLFEAEVTMSKILIDDASHVLVTVRDVSKRKISERDLLVSRKQVTQHNTNLALINQLSNQLHTIDSDQEIFALTADLLHNFENKPGVLIYTMGKDQAQFHLVEQKGFDSKVAEFFSDSPNTIKIINSSFKTNEIRYSKDILTNKYLKPEFRTYLSNQGYRSLLICPLTYRGNKLGLILIANRNIDPITEHTLSVLGAICRTVSLALINAQRRSKLHHMAHHDSLTKLGNREFFHHHFNTKTQNQKDFKAVLFLLDLDRFKEINDTLGHITGDKILQNIGPRLTQVFDENNIDCQVSRLGGDEFTILSTGIDSENAAKLAATKIIDCLREPFVIDDTELEIDVSVGIAMYPKDGSDSHSLLRSADVAMYQAKHQGTGYCYYDPSQDVHTLERLSIMAEIGGAINKGQLFLHYQPKIDINTQQVVGFEALVRWDHPQRGKLNPGLFIPLIEKSNFVYNLTENILHQALSQQQQWRNDGFEYTVAVNLSARNLNDDRIVELLPKLLKQYNTPSGMLELEITETAIMHDPESAIKHLNAISKLGIRLSIDDFGTGHSSLSYLLDLPIKTLKLDREFIMGMINNKDGSKIVEAIIALARSLGLTVIAEGVEDKATIDKLVSLQCHQAQGYYICKPDTWEVIDQWLKSRTL